jgi:hypothetical protein
MMIYFVLCNRRVDFVKFKAIYASGFVEKCHEYNSAAHVASENISLGRSLIYNGQRFGGLAA